MLDGLPRWTAALALAAAASGCSEAPSAQKVSPSRTWVLTPSGVSLVTGGSIADVPLPEWHWAGEPYSCDPVIAVGPAGEAVVTSDVVPVLWQIDPASLAVTKHELVLDADTDQDVGFISRVHAAYFGIARQGSLWRIDPLLRRAQKVQLDAAIIGACGISLRSLPGHRATSVCVRTAERQVAIELAPDQRSGYVRLTPPCALPGEAAASGSARSRAP